VYRRQVSSGDGVVERPEDEARLAVARRRQISLSEDTGLEVHEAVELEVGRGNRFFVDLGGLARVDEGNLHLVRGVGGGAGSGDYEVA